MIIGILKKVRCYEETEEGRIKYFNNYGYKTLVIWESELKDKNKVLERLLNFKNKIRELFSHIN